MRNLSDRWNVEHLHPGVPYNLAEDELGLGSNRLTKGLWISWIHEGGGNAKPRQRVSQQVVAAAIEALGGHNMIACPHERGNRQVQCGLTTRYSNRPNALVEHGDPLFEHRIGGVGQPRINMSRALNIKQPHSILCGIKDE